MKAFSFIIGFYLSVSNSKVQAALRSLPRCKDLSDTSESFYIDSTVKEKTCGWVGNRDRYFRCSRAPIVEQKCPVTCAVPCESEAPSPSPTSSTVPTGSPSFSPSESPSSAPTRDIFCEDRVDSVDKFYVEGTHGDGRRSCEWAARVAEKNRCEIEVVQYHCQLLCDIPCKERVQEPPQIAGLNTGIEQKTPFPYTVVFASIAGGLAAIAIALSVYNRTYGKNAESNSSRDQNRKDELKSYQANNHAVDDEGYNMNFFNWGDDRRNQRNRSQGQGDTEMGNDH